MDFRLMPLAQLDTAGLANLASLHSQVMHTLLSELGAPLVLRYYQVAQGDPSVLGLCALSASDTILGWAMGSPAPDALNAGLRRPLPWFAGQMLRLALIRPRTLLSLIRSVLSVPAVNLLLPGQLELTYIGVAPTAQGQGLGKALLTAFVEEARGLGYKAILLSVETDNPSAVALYTNNGFQITATFNEGSFRRHRMQYTI